MENNSFPSLPALTLTVLLEVSATSTGAGNNILQAAGQEVTMGGQEEPSILGISNCSSNRAPQPLPTPPELAAALFLCNLLASVISRMSVTVVPRVHA